MDILLIKEVEYAIMVLDELNKESPLSAAELSERKNIPSPFIYRVLKKLAAADILEIKRGAHGGYRIKADCKELTLYDVICAFENTFLVIECMKKHYDCGHNKGLGCCIHREFGRIQGRLRTEFMRNDLHGLLSEESAG
ncbi:MAG: Rrf2 family transcriptional regulator [Bacillota bacterium]|nr:Rrf2 family transcriptional regulator [Bacillota bacterium]